VAPATPLGGGEAGVVKPRRTVDSTGVLSLPGGTEDNDLWYESARTPLGAHVFITVWEPDAEERAAIAAGGNVELRVYGIEHPPVSTCVTGVKLGRGPGT
jgi:hypothetical protein